MRFEINEGHVTCEHMKSESVRYFLQHRFHFQFHDEAYAHHPLYQGRAAIGWN